MKPATSYVSLEGSHRELPEGANYLGPEDPQAQLEVSVYLNPRHPVAETLRAQRDGQKGRLSRQEYTGLHGAQADDVELVETFASGHGLRVVNADPTRRLVVLAGTVAAMSAAFGVQLGRYEHRGEKFRGRVGPISIPVDLAGVVQSVLGLDNRIQARPRVRVRPHAGPGVDISYTPPQVAQLYGFPTYGTGAGECIGIIELGGGYVQADLDDYFSGLGLATPNVQWISVDGGSNSPSTPDSADSEVMLDIEVSGSVAPSAQIVVYFSTQDDRGFVDAITTAIFDSVNNPSVISISWGGPEVFHTLQTMQTMDQAFQSAAALGVTICTASGDNGSGDAVGDGLAHADFPSSSPFALGCGGTSLVASSTTSISSETVWNDDLGASGGGVSDVFDLPDYQVGMGVPASANPGGRIGRGVPDVSGNGDPETGYNIRVDGQNIVVGGTSAVAPLWAGLIALLNEQVGEPVGYLNPMLYEEYINETDVVRDIVSGNNGAYASGTGWDACTGLGSPGAGDAWLAAIIY